MPWPFYGSNCMCATKRLLSRLLDKARNGPPVGANETDVNILVKQAALKWDPSQGKTALDLILSSDKSQFRDAGMAAQHSNKLSMNRRSRLGRWQTGFLIGQTGSLLQANTTMRRCS